MSSIMEELLAMSELGNLHSGTIVKGTITEVRQNEVIVDIGGKSEGAISAGEFFDVGELSIGEEIEVFLE
ncbi:MAG: S1 RNA-binding domain-containing protein, partial [Verrucomicrobiota bacterium JB024]|nr:S1 RNA-binding domain-containing protein [Verrucomicrobiota bacterium JB024]